ncbi:MAG: ribonuclease E/G, partial [Mariprofundaceae bacterium]
EFVHAVLPGKEKLVKLYRGKKPLFRHFGVESQCEEIHDHEVRLSSGGSIVIDPTEALTSIDINSSRATKGKHINDTALAINLEAAEEIARQLRIRDIGGLIVIDFIDMVNRKHGQQVEETLRAACKSDKARIQFARISRFGLLEMSRQRLHPSVHESTTEVCPRCQGRGFIRTVEAMALQMLTRMEDLAEAGKKPTLVVQVPSDTGEYLMNNKRDYIARIEENYDVQITLQIRPDLDIPHYRIERQWNENNQQRVEVLEDTSKNKRPVRTGRKLKPANPVVGVPRAVPEKKAAKTSPIKAILDVLTGQKRREKIARQKEEEERLKKEAEGKKRRSRGGRNRRRGKPAQAEKENKASENAEASANQEGNTESKSKRRRRNRKKNGAASEGGAVADNKASDSTNETGQAGAQAEINADTGNNDGNGDAPARRRRRRRRRPSQASATGGEQQTRTSESSSADSAGNKDASPVKVEKAPASTEAA